MIAAVNFSDGYLLYAFSVKGQLETMVAGKFLATAKNAASLPIFYWNWKEAAVNFWTLLNQK